MKPNDELLRKISMVRHKWRGFLWIRGMAWVLGVMVASLLVGLALANSTSVPFWVVVSTRFAFVIAIVGTIIKALVLPLRRVPTDVQLAKFVEEKNPGLEDRLVSAVEAIKKPKVDQGIFQFLLVKDALDRTKNVRFGEQINRRKSRTFTALTATFAIALLIGLYIASLFMPYGLSRLVAGGFRPPDVDSFKIEVTPGDITVPKGSDLTIQAILSGFDAERAEIKLRYDNSTEWESATMEVVPQALPTYRHMLFNLQEAVHYYVEARTYRSDEFTIKVADLPRVEKLDYTYNYPTYTGLVPKMEENATDMIALRGTTVDVVIEGSQPLSGGRLVFADDKSVPLTVTAERRVTGKVTVDRNTTFRIELTNTTREKYLGLEEYAMEALDDQKPILEFTKPGRDYKATSVEEVFTELKAEDDFGVNTLELYYSVNGGEEKKVELFQNKGEAPKEISGSHTFFLEEHELTPGDFVSYYGKAVDSRNPSNSVMTDIYFVEVRPYGREYRQGQQGGGGGGGGGQQDDSAEALSKRQRDIIAATFRLIRDKDKFETKEWTDNVHSVGANQEKLAEQTETLIGRLSRRGLASQDRMFQQLTENLKLAMGQMGPAAENLNKELPEAARPFEDKSLQYLMRAEALYTEIQVTQGGGGGGGGGGQQSAEDLADLFELELDQSKNQFETMQRGEISQNNQEVDEALQKLKELAERQQKQLERQRAQQAQGGGGGGGSQANAQELQRETERLARQLDRLSRENNDPQMAAASRALQQAANNMQQQAQGGSPQQQQQAAQQAQEQLQRAQRLLNQGQGGGTPEERLAQAQDQAQRLKDLENQIAEQTQQLAQNRNGAQLARRGGEINQIRDQAENELKSLQQNLESVAGNSANPEAANKARTAANAIRAGRIAEQMESARGMLETGLPEYAAPIERDTQRKINDLEKQIGQAAQAAGNGEEQKLQNALNQLGDTTQALESMRRRLQDRQQPGQENQQGQQQNQQGQQQGQQPGQQPGQQANRANKVSRANRANRASRVSRANRVNRVNRANKAASRLRAAVRVASSLMAVVRTVVSWPAAMQTAVLASSMGTMFGSGVASSMSASVNCRISAT